MDADTFYEADIPLSKLLLDEENFRIDEVDEQRSAIFAVLHQQREGEKIYNLAEHIVQRGSLAPGERLLVIPNDQEDMDADSYIVMEGNRRVTALKILENPQIIQKEFPKIYKKFADLKSGMDTSLLEIVPCVVMDNREQALEWVEIKHSTQLDGAGLEKWDARATARFSERRGRYRRWRIALSRLENASIDVSEIREGISRKTTAVERVLAAGAIRERLGLIFKNNQGVVEFDNGDEESGVKLLRVLMGAMSEKSFKTSSVHGLYDREDYIENFSEYSVKHIGRDKIETTEKKEDKKELSSNGESDVRSESRSGIETRDVDGKKYDGPDDKREEKPAGKRPLKSKRDRRYLAPGGLDVTYHVIDPQLNALYVELRKLQVRHFEKTALVMTRVFLELSCDLYLVSKSISMPDHFERKGVRRWQDAKLKEKVEATIKDLDPNNKNDDLKYLKKGLGGDDWLHSIETLHSAVHSRVGLSGDEVKEVWNRYHPLFKKIHDDLKESSG